LTEFNYYTIWSLPFAWASSQSVFLNGFHKRFFENHIKLNVNLKVIMKAKCKANPRFLE